MNAGRRPAAVVAFAAASLLICLLGLLAGCKQPPCCEQPEVVLELPDISGSAHSSDLVEMGEQRAFAHVQQMAMGDKFVVHAFNAQPGAACSPLTIELTKQSNPEADQTVRDTALAGFPAAYRDYLGCLAAQPSGGGSAILGAIAEGHAAEPQARAIEVVTDGCTHREAGRTCAKADLHDPGFPARFARQLPDALTPDLTGVAVTFVGLGRGTSLSATELAALRQTYSAWGQRTGATVTFQ